MKQTGEVVPVELKVVKRGRKVALSPHQIAFHARHAELGVRTFILVLYVPAGKVASREGRLLLYAGRQVFELAKSGINTDPVVGYHYGAVPWRLLMSSLAEA